MLSSPAYARGAYDPGLQTLSFAVPDVAVKGDVLLVVAVHANASSITVPAGWTDLGTSNVGGITAHRIARMIDDGDTSALVIATTAAGDEVQGALLLLRGVGSLALLVEASSTLAFAATMAPGSPAVSSLQAIDLVLEVWSASGAHVLAAPAGATLLDTYSTALVAARTLLVASRIANATGALSLGAASSGDNASGSAFAFVLRDSLPTQPLELFDPVPGNIGLLGKDDRPPREVP